jgi:hypothetical protein
MKTLKHLTTESIWLFGRDAPLFAPQLPDALPRSLVHFDLIDYWGTSQSESFGPPLQGRSLLGFYDHIFETLHEHRSERLPNLREISLALHCLRSLQSRRKDRDSDTTSTVDVGDGEGLPADVLAFWQKFRVLFAGIGVRFTVVAPEIIDTQLRLPWANVN